VPSGEIHASPRTAEVDLAAVRAASQGAPPLDDGEGPGEDADERTRLFAQVRAHPLDPDAYQRLADYFDRLGDLERGDLMAEIAGALEGVPEAPARVPRLILSAGDRSGLRHPLLRNEAGELLSLAGQALCHLYPTKGRAAGTRDRFHLEAGPGAAASADALLSAVRILGLRSPDVFLAEDNGPPFSLVFPKELRILVGRAALRGPLPGPELRFFAGRALFTQNPDLLALRTLTVEQLEVALVALEGALFGGRKMGPEARVVREALPSKTVSRLKQLLPEVKEHLELESLVEGARHSANRAGLLVAGAVSPALAALRAKRALEPEVVELVRFAGSERYLKLRRRRLEG